MPYGETFICIHVPAESLSMSPTIDRPVLLININQTSLSSSADTVPISLGYIGSLLKHSGFHVTLLDDLKDRPLSFLKLRDFVLKHRPLYVAFSAYQANMEQIRLVSKFIKGLDPDISVVIGGPQANFMPTEGLLDLCHVDVISRGQGETIARDLALALRDGRPLSEVLGISYRLGDAVHDTPVADSGPDLDIYPSPYLSDVIDLTGKDTAILLTSRGCTYPCVYCYTPRAFHHRIKFHSIGRVIEEMKYCIGRGVRQFWIADPNFSYSRERLESLLDSIIEQDLNIHFWCQTRYDLMDKDLMKRLKQAGIITIAYGMESGSPRVLDNIRKKLDLERLSQAIKLAQSYDVNVELFTMYGLPGEDLADAHRTVDFVKKHDIRIEGNSSCQQLQVYFGTEIEQNQEKFGILDLKKYRPRYLCLGDDFETTTLPAKDINQIKAVWFLNSAYFREKVEATRDVFSTLSFLFRHSLYLKEEPEFSIFLIHLLREVEETALLSKYVGASKHTSQPWFKDWITQVPFYRDSDRAAESGMKVFLDFAGHVNGRPLADTVGQYRPVVLGEGRFLEDFESALVGLKPGMEKEFDCRFPDDYQDEELAGAIVTFVAKVRKVMEPVFVQGIEDIASLGITNDYHAKDLDFLQQTDEALYYLWLRSLTPEDLAASPRRCLDLTSVYLSLNKFPEAKALAEQIFHRDDSRQEVIRLLLEHGLYEFTLDLIQGRNKGDLETQFAEGLCFMGLKAYDRALEVMNRLYNPRNLRLLHCLTEIYKAKNEPREKIEAMEEEFLAGRIGFTLYKEGQAAREAGIVTKETGV